MHRLVKTTLVAGLTGALTVTAAWAGVGLVPVPVPTGSAAETVTGLVDGGSAGDGTQEQQQSVAATFRPPAGDTLEVGASKVNLYPRPDLIAEKYPTEFAGARWEREYDKCTPLAPEYIQRLLTETQQEVDHLAAAGSPWPENPNCLYMGGYGLGPMNPITEFEGGETLEEGENGLWVRSMAVRDPNNDLVVLTVIDGEGWLYDYASKCDDCGIKQIGESLTEELGDAGFTPASFNLHATHSHTSMDFLGGWGFVPDWYMRQATDAIKQSVRDAVANLSPAVVETGVVDARKHNGERRDTYRSAEEPEMTWMRARATRPVPERDIQPGDVLATLGAFAAHPVTEDESGGLAHADWPGHFANEAEERFGGIGMHFMTGLGNVTGARNEQRDPTGALTRESTGTLLARMVPEVGADVRVVDTPDVRGARATWQQPVTNAPLDALGTPGFFDRQFDPTPASITTGKSPDTAPCTSAAPQSVELPVHGFKIGDDVVISTGPGELFSNTTNTIKEKYPDQIVFPLAQTNDSLGYMPQAFELNPVGQQGLGFAAGGAVFVNYEDSYAIDRCVGDMALETTLSLLAGLK